MSITTTAIPIVGAETKREVLARATRRLREQVAAHGITPTTMTLLALYERRYRYAVGPEATLDGIRMECLSTEGHIGLVCHLEENHQGLHSSSAEKGLGLQWA